MINLEKGEGINLTKDGVGLNRIRVGIGWYGAGVKIPKPNQKKETKQGFLSTLGSMLKGEARIGDVVNSVVDGTRSTISDIREEFVDDSYLLHGTTPNVDIDGSVICLRNGRYKGSNDLVSYRGLRHNSGAIRHFGDDVSGKSGYECADKDNEKILVELNKVPSDMDELVFILNIFNCQSKRQHFGMIGDAWIKIYNDETNEELCRFNLTDDYKGYTGMEVGKLYRYNGEWKFKALGEPNKAKSIDDMTKYYN